MTFVVLATSAQLKPSQPLKDMLAVARPGANRPLVAISSTTQVVPGAKHETGPNASAVSVARRATVCSRWTTRNPNSALRLQASLPVSGRHAEERVQPVAGELRHDPAEALDLRAQQAGNLVEQELRPLRPERLAGRGRADNVD
jgi:hypothetical protein